MYEYLLESKNGGKMVLAAGKDLNLDVGDELVVGGKWYTVVAIS
jgi:hypothetical protein